MSNLTYDKYITSEFEIRYGDDAKDLLEMIRTGTTNKYLNPQYNKKFRKQLQKYMNNHPLKGKFYDLIASEDNFLVEFLPTLLGVGGIGSAFVLVTAMLDLKILKSNSPFNDDEDFWSTFLNFFEDDDISIHGLPRMPYGVHSLTKKDNVLQHFKNYAVGYKEEGFFGDHVNWFYAFLYGAFLYGAPDLNTRMLIEQARIPFLSITHKDNSIKAVMNPTYEDMDGIPMNEGYGTIDVNFLVPGNILMALKVLEWFMDNYLELGWIQTYKRKIRYEDFENSLTEDERKSLSHLDWKPTAKKVNSNDNIDILESMLLMTNYDFDDTDVYTNNIKAIAYGGYKLAKKDFDMTTDTFEKETKEEAKMAYRKYFDEDRFELKDAYAFVLSKYIMQYSIFNYKWKEMANKELLTINEDDVKNFIKEIMEA